MRWGKFDGDGDNLIYPVVITQVSDPVSTFM